MQPSNPYGKGIVELTNEKRKQNLEVKFIKEYEAICKKYGYYINGIGNCLERLETTDKLDYEIFDNGFGKQVQYNGIK